MDIIVPKTVIQAYIPEFPIILAGFIKTCDHKRVGVGFIKVYFLRELSLICSKHALSAIKGFITCCVLILLLSPKLAVVIIAARIIQIYYFLYT